MSPHRPIHAAAVALIAGLLLPPSATAQRAASGFAASATALQPSERLGAGSLAGWNATAVLGLSAEASLEAGLSVFSPSLLSGATARESRLVVPSLTVRAPIIGTDNQFALLFGGAAFRYHLGAEPRGGAPAENRIIPAIGLGGALRFHLVGPVQLELSGRDWISYVRQGELTSAVLPQRGFGHSPEFRATVLAIFRPRERTMATFEDLPLSYANDFRPIDASTVEHQPNATTAGRDHLHTDDGTAIGVRAVDPAEFRGDREARGESVVAPTGPTDTFRDEKLGTIYFASGSYAVGTAYRPLLSDVAKYLQQNPTVQLVLMGFTDSVGGARANQSLAEERGTAVEELLSRLFDIAPARMSVTAYGIDYQAKEKPSGRRVDLVARIPAPQP